MKQIGEMLLRNGSFSEIVMGNTALVRGMIEAGTRVVTSYPGSPTPEIAVFFPLFVGDLSRQRESPCPAVPPT